MFCMYCGTSLPADAVFCSKCGKRQQPVAQNTPEVTATSSEPIFSASANAAIQMAETPAPAAGQKPDAQVEEPVQGAASTAQDGANPAPAQQSRPADLDTVKYLALFVDYVQNNPGLQPIRQFMARGAEADKPPQFYNTIPSGMVTLYPEFLIFLTNAADAPGSGFILKELVHYHDLLQLKDLVQDAAKAAGQVDWQAKLKSWKENPKQVLSDATQTLSKHNEESIEDALVNPNSFFIPLGEISAAKSGRSQLQGAYIQIVTQTRSVVVCEDINKDSTFFAFKNIFTQQWQPEVLAMLEERARKNNGQ